MQMRVAKGSRAAGGTAAASGAGEARAAAADERIGFTRV
jgi:hypothetical protein